MFAIRNISPALIANGASVVEQLLPFEAPSVGIHLLDLSYNSQIIIVQGVVTPLGASEIRHD